MKQWTREEHAYLKQLVDNSKRKQWSKFADEMTKAFNHPYNREQVRSYWRTKIRGTETPVLPDYTNKKTTEILPDGKIKAERLLAISDEQAKDPQFLLEKFGFDHTEFKLIKAKVGEWNQHNKQDGTLILRSCSLIVEPLEVKEIDYDEIGRRIASKAQARTAKPHITNHSDQYLVIPWFDPHFGNNKLEDYDTTLGKILNILNNDYREILIIAGGDQLHNDNHRGTTSSGTVIDKVDMTQAWEDAFDFLDIVIDKALDSAEKVNVMYVPGNHDEMTGQTLFKALEKVYRDEDRLHIDSEHCMFKATLLGHNFIGASHGDKSNKNKYPMIYATSFSQLWGKESVITREVFVGHLHHESVIDKDGLLIRQAPTRNKADQYHMDNGFMSAHKRFSVVSYDEYEPTAVHYI